MVSKDTCSYLRPAGKPPIHLKSTLASKSELFDTLKWERLILLKSGGKCYFCEIYGQTYYHHITNCIPKKMNENGRCKYLLLRLLLKGLWLWALLAPKASHGPFSLFFPNQQDLQQILAADGPNHKTYSSSKNGSQTQWSSSLLSSKNTIVCLTTEDLFLWDYLWCYSHLCFLVILWWELQVDTVMILWLKWQLQHPVTNTRSFSTFFNKIRIR